MKRSLLTMLVFMFAVCVIGTAVAGDFATKDECIAKCKEAAAMVKDKGLDAALAAVGDKSGPFVWKDSYVFCIDLEKKANVAHPIKPKLVGKNLMHVKDVNGKLFFAEFVNVAKEKGEGWVDYMWPRPGEKKPIPKSTYVYRVPGESVFMAAGTHQ